MCTEVERFSLVLQEHFTEASFWGWYGDSLKALVLKEYGGHNGCYFKVYDVSSMYDRPKIAGTFAINEFPGAGCLALVFHSVFLAPSYQGKGIGSALLAVREEAARKFGSKLLLATVRSNNDKEAALLSKHGWLSTLVMPSKNKGVNVALWTKKL